MGAPVSSSATSRAGQCTKLSPKTEPGGEGYEIPPALRANDKVLSPTLKRLTRNVTAVEASLGNQAALATRPHGQVDFRLVGTGLHGKPCKGRVNRSPGACVFDHTSDVPAPLFGQVWSYCAKDPL
jgi:hypothetical protein